MSDTITAATQLTRLVEHTTDTSQAESQHNSITSEVAKYMLCGSGKM